MQKQHRNHDQARRPSAAARRTIPLGLFRGLGKCIETYAKDSCLEKLRVAGCELSVSHSHSWLWLTAFVAGNLVQASFTGFYPLAKILKALGLKPGVAFSWDCILYVSFSPYAM